MRVFLDSADISEIKDAYSTGLIDGVTTNPTIMAKSKLGIKDTIEAIASIVHGPISVEVVSLTLESMLSEALDYSSISKNVVIKVPTNKLGFRLVQGLYKKGIKTNMTLCFSPVQALFAAKSGADYVSPFIGRLDDLGRDGLRLIEDIRDIYDNYEINTNILAASVRNINHIIECAKIGADCITINYKLFEQAFENLMTKNGVDIFTRDWNFAVNR